MKRVAILLDETGSMKGQETKVVTGINEYINGLAYDKADPALWADIVINLCLFDSNRWRTFYDGPIANWPGMELSDYKPGSTTPLYDAIARFGAELSEMDETEKTLFIIDTDGLENASTQYTKDMVNIFIKEKEEAGWAFLFLGVDFEKFGGAYKGTQSMGISSLNRGSTYTMPNADRVGTYATSMPETSRKYFSGTISNLSVADDLRDEVGSSSTFKEMLRQAGLNSQAHLARELSITESTISRWKGKAPPSVEAYLDVRAKNLRLQKALDRFTNE